MKDEDLKKVGEEVVKKRGRKKGCTRPEQQVHTEPGENTKYINHSLRLATLPKVDLKSTEQVGQRVMRYFEICAEDDMKPSVVGLALALDIDRVYLWELRTGRKGKNPEVANVLKKACHVIELQMNDYMQNGKINPVSGIFLMKALFGYEEKVKVEVVPDPLGATKDVKLLEDKYAASVAEVPELPPPEEE